MDDYFNNLRNKLIHAESFEQKLSILLEAVMFDKLETMKLKEENIKMNKSLIIFLFANLILTLVLLVLSFVLFAKV